jgi:DMSO/TMAO reductase YedYZ molybdopterin-dependent catalytic subunit
MTTRREPREFLAGVLAAGVMLAGMLLLRLMTGVQSLPELLGEGFIRILPPELFSRLLDTLLRAAKPTLVASIVVGTLIVGGGLGRLYGRQPSWKRALQLALAAWLLVGLGLLPLLGLGFFGSAFRIGPLAIGATLAAAFLLFALALRFFHSLLLAGDRLAENQQTRREDRRRALAGLGLGLAALAVGGYGWRALTSPGRGAASGVPSDEPPAETGASAPPASATDASVSAPDPAAAAADSSPPSAPGQAGAARISFSPAPGEKLMSGPFAVAGLSAEVTPVGEFYNVSKNFFDPQVDGVKWKLTIDGLVERPMTFDYESIRQLPAVSDFYTLQCISNPVGGDLWGNGYWKGVKLADLLAQTGIKPGARDAVFRAEDDYSDSVTLERALNQGAILAYELNGAPLTKTHGFPARLLIPNIYGMKNVKWITSIELVDYDFKGYWMQRGWSDSAVYKVSSRIDTPATRASLSTGEVEVAGVAFAGERGISQVEISTDNGQTWQPAELKPALARNTWQLWAARPTLPPGTHTIKVRATDGSGDLQTSTEAEPLPDGASGYHTVLISAG